LRIGDRIRKENDPRLYEIIAVHQDIILECVTIPRPWVEKISKMTHYIKEVEISERVE